MNKIYIKYIIYLILASVVAFLVYFLVYRGKNDSYEAKNQPSSIEIIGDSNDKNEKDADNDGLKDWEETLWGTDPRVKDTDGDGTNDGQEVAQNRDPKVKGPNDKITSVVNSEAIDEENSDYQSLNNTEKLGRDLFAKYLYLKQTGQALDQKSEQVLVEDAVKNIVLSQDNQKISEKSLQTIPDSTKNFKDYGNATGQAFRQTNVSKTDNKDNELILMASFIEKNDENAILKLEERSETYRLLAEKLSKIKTPGSLAKNHANLVNDVNSISISISSMAKLKTDPILSIAGVGQFNKDIESIKKDVNSIVSFFKQKAIVFNSSEPGYSFTVPIR